MKLEDAISFLNLNSNYTLDELKKSYRSLAVKYHPDKSGSNEKFQELQTAYEMLLKTVNENENIDVDVSVTEELTLEEMYGGKSSSLTFTKIVKCQTCVEDVCKLCNGSGQITKAMSMGHFQFMTTQPCSCGGKSSRCLCEKKETVTVNYFIPRGIFPGADVNLPIQGSYIGNGKYRNVRVKILEKKDNLFSMSRENNNLVYTMDLSLSEMLCGFSKDINHPGGTPVNISTDKIIKRDDVIVKSGLGMPFLSDNSKFGDLIIKFKINYIELTPEQKEIITSILETPTG
jgi:DnaJ-class molecular chaperone